MVHDLVVMGAPPQGRVRSAFGSLSHYLVRHSPAPVLVVHAARRGRVITRHGGAGDPGATVGDPLAGRLTGVSVAKASSRTRLSEQVPRDRLASINLSQGNLLGIVKPETRASLSAADVGQATRERVAHRRVRVAGASVRVITRPRGGPAWTTRTGAGLCRTR